eukprot:GSA25T00023007001.1
MGAKRKTAVPQNASCFNYLCDFEAELLLPRVREFQDFLTVQVLDAAPLLLSRGQLEREQDYGRNMSLLRQLSALTPVELADVSDDAVPLPVALREINGEGTTSST